MNLSGRWDVIKDMSDLDTFERRLVREMDDVTGEIRPDLDLARSRVNARRDSHASSGSRFGSGRGTFLAVAAGLTLVVGAGTFALVQPRDASTDSAATTLGAPATTLPPFADSDDSAATEQGDPADPTASDTDDPAEQDPAFLIPAGTPAGDIAPPTARVTEATATRVTASATDFESDSGDVSSLDTITALADDGRFFASNINGDLIEQPTDVGTALGALAANRNADAGVAAEAMLRATGTDPAQATSTTIDTRLWFLATDALATGALSDDSWTDVLRAVETIDTVRFAEADVEGSRQIAISFYEAPGGGVWSMLLDGSTGHPIQSERVDRNGELEHQVTYLVERIEIPAADTEPDVAPVVVAAPIVVGPLGIEVAASDDVSAVSFWGTDASDLVPMVADLLGEPEQWVAGSCEVNPVLEAVTWPSLSLFFINEKFVGWFARGDGESDPTIAATNGVSIGSTIEELLERNEAAQYIPDGTLGPEFFDGAVTFFATEEDASGIVTFMQAGQTCVAR